MANPQVTFGPVLNNFGGGNKDHLRIAAAFKFLDTDTTANYSIQGQVFNAQFAQIDVSTIQGVQTIGKILTLQYSMVSTFVVSDVDQDWQMYIVIDDIQVFVINGLGPLAAPAQAVVQTKTGVMAVDSNTPPKTVKFYLVGLNGIGAQVSLFVNLLNFRVPPFTI